MLRIEKKKSPLCCNPSTDMDGRQNPEAHWPASLAYLERLRSMKGGQDLRNDSFGCLLASRCTDQTERAKEETVPSKQAFQTP